MKVVNMAVSSKLGYLFLSFLIAFLVIVIVGTTVYPVTPRIFGGIDAPDGKYPYMVSLRFANEHFCGGSVLNSRWILTAAHCVEIVKYGRHKVEVIVGTNRLDDGGQKYHVENTVIHDRWYNPKMSNDIGLIRVNKTIEFNARVGPIQLTEKDYDEAGHPVTMIGWGRWDKFSIQSSNKLQEIILKIVAQYACKRKYFFTVEINVSHICTLTKAGEGICSGDSGSPLIADGVQIGIASFISRPCASGNPDVYARVYTFLDWIKEQLEEFPD